MALTETVINDTYDFRIGRRLCNLDDLQKIGFAANRRLLGVQRISHRCQLGAEVFHELHRPAVIDDRRVSTLRFGDPRVQALLATLLAFRLLPVGSPTANCVSTPHRYSACPSTPTARPAPPTICDACACACAA